MKERKFTKWHGIFYIIVLSILFGGCLSICKDINDTTFQQIGYFKSETRPYVRIKSIATHVTDRDSLIEYARKATSGDTGGHTTRVFFTGEENTPDVTLVRWDYPEEYNKHLILKYIKKSNGEIYIQEF